MSARVLREAAALMRADAHAVKATLVYDGDPVDRMPETPLTNYTQAWHPAVALAVADWLEAEAEAVDFQVQCDRRYRMRDNDEALAVANAYLATPPH